jgi:hypothetical protein
MPKWAKAMNSCRCQANCCGLGDGRESAARAFAGLRQKALMSRAKAASRFSATGGLFTNSELSGAKGYRATASRDWSTQTAKQKVESRKQKWGRRTSNIQHPMPDLNLEP